MSKRMDHTLALVLVMLLHATGLMLALGVAPESSVAAVVDNHALDITWVARRASPAPKAVSEPRTHSRPAVGARARPTSRPAFLSTMAEVATRDVQNPDARSDTPASIDSVVQRPLDLRLPEIPINYERNPLARRGPRMEAYQDRMTLQFSDSSTGGTMQRMAKSQICSELRRALRTAGGGAYGVIESMQEQGCPI